MAARLRGAARRLPIARAERRGPIDQPEALGLALADMLRADGADEILASL